MATAQAAEPGVTPVVERIFTQIGARQTSSQQRFKTEQAIRSKIENRIGHLRSFEAALHKINDAFRYAVVLEADRFAMQAQHLFAALAQAGMEVKEVRNAFTAGAPYKAVNITVGYQNDDKSGTFEIQLHTQAGFDAKQVTRSAYVRLRDKQLSSDERAALNAQRSRANAAVVHPAGIEQVTLNMATQAASRSKRGSEGMDASDNEEGQSSAKRLAAQSGSGSAS